MPTTLKTPRLERLTQLIDAWLAKALAPVDGAPAILHDAMQDSVLAGGKRFRPLLCLGGCEAAGASTRRALPAACAIELMHAYSLVHDDLPAMDNAAQRRGRPSCHRAFGEATAILTGDALLTRAFELLSGPRLPNALRIAQHLARAGGAAGLIGGQVLDLACAAGGKERTANPMRQETTGASRLIDIARRKTGALIKASVVIGGLAAEAPHPLLQRLQRYGHDVGLAFQLVDDLHDRDGLVPVMGADAVRRQAQDALRRAHETIAPLARRAAVLRQLAEWLAASAQEG